ncbi:hypothetical protein PM082_018917 [Marasmius tenuissimus]|nr:hypothetical protein PM082_018917 [Marasmius tenuissimus]
MLRTVEDEENLVNVGNCVKAPWGPGIVRSCIGGAHFPTMSFMIRASPTGSEGDIDTLTRIFPSHSQHESQLTNNLQKAVGVPQVGGAGKTFRLWCWW